MCASVAGDRSPSNVPLRVSLFPSSVAVAEPDPVIVAFIAASMGATNSRALSVSPVWATLMCPAKRITPPINIPVNRLQIDEDCEETLRSPHRLTETHMEWLPNQLERKLNLSRSGGCTID